MERYYLTEDIAQIQHHFPGSEAVAIETPFDLTDKPVQRRTYTDIFQTITPKLRWDIRWIH
ncbi:hypothetical protein KDA06_01585 [Candidatus Saccharibacteria bacterium]|jgi:hypothetical protein|nr:hypothetical protein [Candidatus Saccharibacteria bacterium]